MSRDVKETLRETIAKTHLMGFLQVRGYKCTPAREAVAEVLEEVGGLHALDEILEISNLGRMTVYRVLKTLREEGLVHYSASKNAYFACQKLYSDKAKSSCHSFGVCQKCSFVREVIETNHAHPKIQGFTHESKEHEWLGLCTSCRLRA